MKKLFATFTAMAFALSIVSCDDLNWGGDEEVQDSTDTTVTIQTSYYYGGVTVAQDGEVTYQTDDKMVATTTDSNAGTISITMKEMKFAENMPLSLDIMFSDVEPSTIGDYYYAATITPTATDGEPITYVEITRLVIVTMDEELMVKFDCTMYGTTTYSVTFLTDNITDEGQGDEEEDLDSEEEDITPSTPSGTEYVGEMNVAQDGVVSYTDSAAVLYATIDETKESLDVTLSGVKFSAFMPITLDLTFSDVAYDAASGSYYAASTTPTDADGAEMTSVAISDFTFTQVSEDVISVSFICTYGGSDYTITFTNSEEDITPSTPSGTEYVGEMNVAQDGEVTYQTDDKMVTTTTDSDAGTISITMKEIKFAENMPLSLDIMFSDVEPSTIGDYYYAATITPTATDGEPITYVEITRLVIVTMDEELMVKFDCTMYGTTTYSVTFTTDNIVDEGQGDEEEDLTTSTPSGTEYVGEMNVAQNGEVSYTDGAAVLYATIDETKESLDATLSGVKFSAFMPITLDLTFSDVAYDAASGSYYAASTTPTDADGAEMTSVAISDFTFTQVSEDVISVSFICTYGGSDYTITFTNDEEEDNNNNDDDTSIDTVLRSFEGVMEVEKDDVAVYTDSATAVNYTKSAAEVNVVLPSVKFSAYMPVTIYMAINNVEYRDDLGHYYINETVALDADGEELSSVVIREFMLYEENSYTVAISFICNYNGTDYEISYNAELQSVTVDPDPVYYGAMSVSNGYSDDNTYAIVLSNADSTANVILEEVKFSAYMPTIYMDFQDIALNNSGIYYAETITPLDSTGEAVSGASISNFSLTYVTENYVSISFICTYGGSDYTIAFEGSNI